MNLKGERIIKGANGFFFKKKKERRNVGRKNYFFTHFCSCCIGECGNFSLTMISEAIMHDFHEVDKKNKK